MPAMTVGGGGARRWLRSCSSARVLPLRRAEPLTRGGLYAILIGAGGSETEVCGPAAMASSKALPFPAVGRNARRVCRIHVDQMVVGEALGELAGLGVPLRRRAGLDQPDKRGPQQVAWRSVPRTGAMALATHQAY